MTTESSIVFYVACCMTSILAVPTGVSTSILALPNGGSESVPTVIMGDTASVNSVPLDGSANIHAVILVNNHCEKRVFTGLNFWMSRWKTLLYLIALNLARLLTEKSTKPN